MFNRNYINALLYELRSSETEDNLLLCPLTLSYANQNAMLRHFFDKCDVTVMQVSVLWCHSGKSALRQEPDVLAHIMKHTLLNGIFEACRNQSFCITAPGSE